MVKLGQGIAQNAIAYRVPKAATADAHLTAGTFKAVFAAIQVIVWFAPVLARFILCQMVITFARIGYAFAIDAVTAVPPSICSAIGRLDTTGGFRVGFASIFRDMMVFHTFG